MHTNYKKKISILFSFGMSLDIWNKKKIFTREVDYYKNFFDHNFSCQFITFGSKSDLSFKKELGEIEVFPLFSFFKKNIISKFLIIFIIPLILKNFIKNTNIVKTHQISSGLVAILIKMFFKKKVICRAGWEPTFDYKLWNISFIKYLLYWFNSYISYKFCNKIIVTTSEIKNFIIKKYHIDSKKISIIPNSVDTKKFKKIANQNNFKFISVSRFVEQKNLLKLIDVANKSNIELDILGDGPLKKNLISYIKQTGSKVRLLEPVDYDQIPRILSNYNSFISCSKVEGSPKAILEAMSCELTVFTLSSNGISNLIINNDTGFVANDVDSLTEIINSNGKKLDRLKLIGKNAREFIKQNFSLEKCIELESKIYNEL